MDYDALTSNLAETNWLKQLLVSEGTHRNRNVLDLAPTNVEEFFHQDSKSVFIEFSDRIYLCFQLPDYWLIPEETASKLRLLKHFYEDLYFDLVTSAFSAIEKMSPLLTLFTGFYVSMKYF